MTGPDARPAAEADPRIETLSACRTALGRETHVLRERPELTWQQLYNRLQWEEGSLTGRLEPQVQRRSGPGASPWLHTRTRSRESDDLRLTLTGHTETVRACAISPDSTYIVTASWDRTARIWDAATGRERATLTGHTETVRACAISPDSTYIVTASWDRTARMWDAATGRERATLTGHASGIDACAISPDSTYIVTASRDATAKIWDAATGRERATLTGHTDVVNACAISPDSTYIVTASRDDTAKIWDAATGRERVNLPLLGAGMCAALHPWRPFAVWGELGGNVCLMDLVGIACGPIVVTAVDLGKGARPALRCPKCLQFHPLNDAWLGQVIVCPTPECSLSLSVNPFVTRMAVRSD